MDVHDVIASGQRAHGEEGEGNQNERGIVKEILECAAAAVPVRNTKDVDAIHRLTLRILFIL